MTPPAGPGEVGFEGTARLRALPAGPDQAVPVQACLDGAADWFALTEGEPSAPDAARRLLSDAEADGWRAVYLLSPRAGGPAAGLVDLHLGYPEPGVAHLGLFLLRPAERGRGHGREVVEALAAALAVAGYRALRLSVVDEDALAASFWEHLGFAAVGRLPGGVTVLERPLG